MGRTTGEIIDHVELMTRIKKDPKCHEENFTIQYEHFNRLCQLLALEPTTLHEQLIHLISFISNVVNNYKSYIPKFVDKLISLIEGYGHQLESTIRLVICKVLLKQKNENSIEPLKLYKILIGLFDCKDKVLRKSLQHLIMNNIKNSNKKHYNNKTNLAIQSYFFKVIQQQQQQSDTTKDNEAIILAILNIVISLWRRQIWNNEKTVNMISYVCFNENYKVSFTAIRFFLANQHSSNNEVRNVDSDDDDDDETKKMNALLLIKGTKSDTKPTIARTSRKRKRKLDKALEYINKIEKKKKSRLPENSIGDSSAIRLLNDPQTFADKLLKKFNKSKNRFEMKLMILEVIARVISIHELIVPNYYSLIQRYLRPHQQNAVRILTALVQSCHKLVPDDYIGACIKTIAANFISQHSVSEFAAVGMNTVREICWRSPYAIEESLAQELVSLEKGINGSNGIDRILAIASKSLLQTLRIVNPKVLLRKDRVRSFYPKTIHSLNDLNQDDDNPLDVTTSKVYTTIPGLEYLTNNTSSTSTQCNTVCDDNCCSDDISGDSDSNENNNHDHDHDQWDDISTNNKQSISGDTVYSRFLTDQEFKFIKRNKLKCEAQQFAKNFNSNKNKQLPLDLSLNDDDDTDESPNTSAIHNDDIIGVEKVGFVTGLKKKHVNAELIPSVANLVSIKKTPELRKKSNAEYRSKVFNDWRFNPSASKTQREKRKSKPFMMIKHKRQVRGKAKKSTKDRIATLRKTIKNAGKIRH